MAGIGRYKLSDAMPKPPKEGGKKGGRSEQTLEITAEQSREARERKQARNAEASNRDRMEDIGRGNQQAGRQGT